MERDLRFLMFAVRFSAAVLFLNLVFGVDDIIRVHPVAAVLNFAAAVAAYGETRFLLWLAVKNERHRAARDL